MGFDAVPVTNERVLTSVAIVPVGEWSRSLSGCRFSSQGVPMDQIDLLLRLKEHQLLENLAGQARRGRVFRFWKLPTLVAEFT